MGNFYEDNEDLRFYVERGLDWAPLVELTEYEWRSEGGFTSVPEAKEFYTDLLSLVGNFVADEIAPVAAEVDRQHPTVGEDGDVVLPEVQQPIFDALKEMELYGMCLPRELGGMNCPVLLFSLTNEIFARADVSVTAHYGFHGGIAMAALVYSIFEGTTTFDEENARITETRFAEAIESIRTGESWGSMDITEPSAGSDMAQLRTKGVQDEDGNWTVSGEKIFITSGNGRWHFVIARTEEAAGDDAFAGLKGLSMFLVPAWSLDKKGNKVWHSTLAKCEEKLGHNGSATVAIVFNDAPAQLIGKRGDGFKHMLLLMNNARVGVALESLGLSEAAYRMAKAYAAERPSMGKTIDKHEMIADYLDEMQTEIQSVRALTLHAAWHEEMGQKLNIKLKFFPPEDPEEVKKLERQVKRHQKAARMATPLIKYLASENAVKHAQLNIQIHGGVGYTTEYGAEKLLRDAMVFPIYEGTSQIQALMAMKDNLVGVIKDPRKFARTMAKARWGSLRGNETERRVAHLRLTACRAIQFLMTRLAGAKFREVRGRPMGEWTEAFADFDPKKDFALAMLHAERLTKILGDAACAEVLLEQAKAHPDRQELLERFLERAEPRARFNYDQITTTGLRLLRTLSDEPEIQEKAAK